MTRADRDREPDHDRPAAAWVNVNPVTRLADSVRALTIGGQLGDSVFVTLAWAGGIVIVVFPIAMRMYRRRA